MSATDANASSTPAAPVILLSGQDCVEGGSHSLYAYNQGDEVVPGFKYGNVYERLGRPTLTSSGPYTSGPLRGNWAAVFSCKSWTSGPQSGAAWVWSITATQIAPPAFDTDPAPVEYLLELFAIHDAGLEARLAALGLPVTRSLNEEYAWPASGILHVDQRYEGVADYQAVLRMAAPKPRADEWIRIWTIAKESDGKFHPLSIDMRDQGGTQIVGENGAEGAAERQALNGSPAALSPGAPISGLAFEGFSRTVSLGPRPDVTVLSAWTR